MVRFRSRAFQSDGVVWHVWPSVLGTDVGCRPVKVRDLGPPRFFLHAQTGEFFVVLHADASWESLAQLSEETLRAWASEQLVDRSDDAKRRVGSLQDDRPA